MEYAGSLIRKAVIPVAGRGMRLMPITSVVPKAMFPLVDGRNDIRSNQFDNARYINTMS